MPFCWISGENYRTSQVPLRECKSWFCSARASIDFLFISSSIKVMDLHTHRLSHAHFFQFSYTFPDIFVQEENFSPLINPTTNFSMSNLRDFRWKSVAKKVTQTHLIQSCIIYNFVRFCKNLLPRAMLEGPNKGFVVVIVLLILGTFSKGEQNVREKRCYSWNRVCSKLASKTNIAVKSK